MTEPLKGIEPAITRYYDHAPEESRLEHGAFHLEGACTRELIERHAHFILYSQIAAQSLFDGRFAHSPFVWSEEDEPTVIRFEGGVNAAAQTASFLYLSLGDQEVQTKPPFERTVRFLETQAPPTLRWRADVSVGGDHNSNPRLSTPVGLYAMFALSSGLACRVAPP